MSWNDAPLWKCTAGLKLGSRSPGTGRSMGLFPYYISTKLNQLATNYENYFCYFTLAQEVVMITNSWHFVPFLFSLDAYLKFIANIWLPYLRFMKIPFWSQCFISTSKNISISIGRISHNRYKCTYQSRQSICPLDHVPVYMFRSVCEQKEIHLLFSTLMFS